MDRANVYAAELEAVRLALELAQSATKLDIHIYTDNQAAILSTANPAKQSGQFILIKNAQLISKLRELGYSVTLHWIPAHEGGRSSEQWKSLVQLLPQVCMQTQTERQHQRYLG
ncbi:MAG: hypothetical protein MMC33_007967 [Icmadophila ericetorum]|nr:hypothetical protein [Icmadophila ericetorum]